MSAAYGLAVALTMLITSALAFVVARRRWGWSLPTALALTTLWVVVDVVFLGANLAKLLDGGFLPLFLALAAFVLMTTWRRGRFEMGQKLRTRMLEVDDLIQRIQREKPHRVPGPAVFLTADDELVPPVLMHNYQHNGVLHEHVVLLSMVVGDVPRVWHSERLQVQHFDAGITRVVAHYGFTETPDPGRLFREDAVRAGHISFFIARHRLSAAGRGLARWRRQLFVCMSRSAGPSLVL